MKKAIGVLLAAALALSLGGCGGGGEGRAAQKNADGATVLTLWRPQDQKAVEEWYLQQIDAFNAQYQGKYELRQQIIIRADSFAYDDKLNAAVTSNTLPDVMMIDGPNISAYAANGILLPLDDYISEGERADFLASTITQNTYGGKLYALGNTESSVALYYNKDMLDAIGVTAPTRIEDAWTWSQYYDIAKRLTTPEVMGARIIMDKGEGLTYVMEQFWLSNGTDIISEDGAKAQGYLNSEAGVEAAAYLNRFIQEKIASIDPLPTEFQTGKAATMLGGCWDVATMGEYPDLNWGITYFPKADGGKATSPTGDWSYTISKNTADVQGAAEAIRFLTSQQNTTAYARALGKPPARKSSFEEMQEYDVYPQSVFKDQLLQTGTPRPRTPVYTILSPKFAQGMMDIFTGADVKATLDMVAREVDDEYAYNYADAN